MKFKKKQLWALILWPESLEITINAVKDLSEVVDKKLIKVGWTGELPWVDEHESTTLYEARILKINYNKLYLESLNIDIFGRAIKQSHKEAVMAENQKLKNKKRANARAQQRSKDDMNESILSLPAIGNKEVANSLDNDKKPSLNRGSEAPCLRCSDCVCENWKSQITPQLIRVFEKMLQSMKKEMINKNPCTVEIENMVELYPTTGIILSQKDIDICVAKGINKPPALVRELLMKIVTPEELIAYKTAKKMYEERPCVRDAILGFLKHNREVEMSVRQYNEIVKKKIQFCIQAMKPKEEIEEKKEKMRQKIREIRKNKIQKNKQSSSYDLNSVDNQLNSPSDSKEQQKALQQNQNPYKINEPKVDPNAKNQEPGQISNQTTNNVSEQQNRPQSNLSQHFHPQQFHAQQFHPQQYHPQQFYPQQYQYPPYHNNYSSSSYDLYNPSTHPIIPYPDHLHKTPPPQYTNLN